MRLRDGWTVCRSDSLTCNATKSWKAPTLPTTALLALLAGREDIYFGTNLLKYKDVNETGRDFYTLTWEHEIPREARLVELRSVNYRATVAVDGTELESIDAFGGMFARRRYQLPSGQRLSIRVEPPDHCGSATICPANETCGQGGDHSLAKDLTAQFFLGWDWQQAIPDRSTGFFDGVDVFFDDLHLRDAAVLVDEIECKDICQSHGNVRARVVATVTSTRKNHDLAVRLIADFGNQTTNSTFFKVHNTSQDKITADILLPHLELWWPRGVFYNSTIKTGVRHLVQIRLEDTHGKVYAATSVKFGARIFETYEEDVGRAFKVNHERIFLLGGNWITPDATFTRSTRERYRAEVSLHAAAGLNAIRVWGGGVAEKDEFYEVCDDLGIVVYQEFWMTGDNNGRWAGSYDWPLDQAAYEAAVTDTALRLRRFASVLFLGGGNELYPAEKSPPPFALAAISRALRLSQQHFIFLPSSMDGGLNGGNDSEHSNQYALTPKDGPYGMLMAEEWAHRNPGLNDNNLAIAFQPEIGSASAPPDLETLACFLPTDTISPPPENDLENFTDPNYTLHRYLSFATQLTNATVYNHAYAYADNTLTSLTDWLAYAKLAQHQQYQLLVASFAARTFAYYTAIFIWKTQSPWPALRGFLYDWYLLRPTGGWRGVRAASSLRGAYLSNLTSLDGFTLVNRAILPWPNVSLRYDWFSIVSNITTGGSLSQGVDVPATSTIDLSFAAIEQPKSCLAPCLLRLRTFGGSDIWYWRSLTKSSSGGPDYSAFGEVRRSRRASAEFAFKGCTLTEQSAIFHFEIFVPAASPEALFYPEITLESQSCASPRYAAIPDFEKKEGTLSESMVFIQPGSTVSTSLYLLPLFDDEHFNAFPNSQDRDTLCPSLLNFSLGAWNLDRRRTVVAF